MDVRSDSAEDTVDSGDRDGDTIAVLPPDVGAEAGAGAMVIGLPGSGCRVVSYTHTAFLERTQLLQGVSLLHLILRCLHTAQDL